MRQTLKLLNGRLVVAQGKLVSPDGHRVSPTGQKSAGAMMTMTTKIK